MEKIFAGIVSLFLFVALVGLFPSSVSAAKWINVLPGVELFGCAPDDLAAHLTLGGFTTTGSPVLILCSAGYSSVYRVLP